jgi:hypothetical protein
LQQTHHFDDSIVDASGFCKGRIMVRRQETGDRSQEHPTGGYA